MWTPFGLLLWLYLSPNMAMPDPTLEAPASGNLSDYDMMMMMTPPPAMEDDMSLCEYLLNGPVSSPIENIPWHCICSHCKGTVGPKGDYGDRGLPGRPGSPGRRGFTGRTGWPGFTGRPGFKGQKGDEGEKGGSGQMGFTGAKGQRGYKGDKGDQGLEGRAGQQGLQGEPGQCQEPCESITGPAGPPGLPGMAGPRGLLGKPGGPGAKGDKGDLGDEGPAGQPGADGLKGDQGVEGACNCQDGADGVNGTEGPAGPKGDSGPIGPQGEKGEIGEKGDMGLEGLMGMPGLCSPAIQSAFSAALATSFPPPKKPVVFARILYNMQDHFSSDGIYTAPVNGTYVFSYHLVVYSRVLTVGLFHNFIPVVITTEASNMGTASQQVVLHLNRGDEVWLLVKDDTTNGMYTGFESSSTFSGYLLHPDSCEVAMFRELDPFNPFEPSKNDREYVWDLTPTSAP